MIAARMARPATPSTLSATTPHATPVDPRAPRGVSAGYRRFVAAAASWFGAWGMQHVLFSFLVVNELGEDPARVGLAGMFQTLPALALLLFGGAIADRLDRRRVLLAAHVTAAVAAALMAYVVGAGLLSFGVVCGYAVCWGVLQSFVLPARDAVLSDVAGEDLQRGVTGVTLVQFIAQAAGNAVAGTASVIGTSGALLVQAAVALCGGAPARALPRSAAGARGRGRPILHEMTDGLREVVHSPRLRPIFGLVACNGLFFAGPYFVCIPVILRDHYAGGVADLAAVLMMFPLGTISGSLLLLWRGGIRRKGRALMIGLASGSACLASISLALPFWGLLAAVYAWGLAGAVFLNMSRTLFQEATSPSHRARVMSVYSLGIFGIAPFANLFSGGVAEWIGALAACAVAGGSMLAVLGYATLRSDIARMD